MGNDVSQLVVSGNITLFVVLNWLFTLSMAGWLFIVIQKFRYLIVKPSIMLLGFTHLFFQWPLCIFSANVEQYLPEPYEIFLLIHCYMFFGFLFMSFTLRREAKVAWENIADSCARVDSNQRPIFMLLGFCASVALAYLKMVPFNQTGMYALFVDPELASTAREESLKLIDSQWLKYAYSFMAEAVSLMLASMLVLQINYDRSLPDKKIVRPLFYVAVLLALMMAVSFTGARGYAVNLVLVIIITFWLRGGAKFPIGKGLLVICVVLLPAAILTIAREGDNAHWDTLVSSLLTRSFVVPFDVGLWHTHYVQHNGFWGASVIPKLSTIVGAPVIDVPNVVGLAYAAFPIPSISANTGYLFAQYSAWGLYALPVTLAGLFLLELIPLVFVRLKPQMVLPCVAAVVPIILAFVSADYTVVWMTHGLLVVIVLAWILSRMMQLKFML